MNNNIVARIVAMAGAAGLDCERSRSCHTAAATGLTGCCINATQAGVLGPPQLASGALISATYNSALLGSKVALHWPSTCF